MGFRGKHLSESLWCGSPVSDPLIMKSCASCVSSGSLCASSALLHLRRGPRLFPTVLTHLGTRMNALKGTKQPEPDFFYFFFITIRHPLLARAHLTAATESSSANQGRAGWAWLVLDRGSEGGKRLKGMNERGKVELVQESPARLHPWGRNTLYRMETLESQITVCK